MTAIATNATIDLCFKNTLPPSEYCICDQWKGSPEQRASKGSLLMNFVEGRT